MTRIPISRYVASHGAHLARLQRSTELAATRTELTQAKEDTAAAIHAALNLVADERASRDAVLQLADAQDALHREVTALQGVVSTCIPRSELLHIKSVAAELQTFAGWKAAAAADLADLQVRTGEHREAVDLNRDSLSKLSAVVQALAGQTASKAEGAALDRLAAVVDRLGSEVQQRATTEEVRRVSAAVASVSTRAGALEAGAEAATARAAADKGELQAAIAAASSTLREEAGRAAARVASELDGLREEIEARAYVSSLAATDESVGELRSAADTLQRQLEVAMRFIDWYAEKGEAYEYNAASLERHMNALAVGNRSRTVTPGAPGGGHGAPGGGSPGPYGNSSGSGSSSTFGLPPPGLAPSFTGKPEDADAMRARVLGLTAEGLFAGSAGAGGGGGGASPATRAAYLPVPRGLGAAAAAAAATAAGPMTGSPGVRIGGIMAGSS